ncbi:hypothetical protein Q1695_014957 [Nippostrongylus brasiliensis]|nr:hypothetical protein Q1695_014957 [Nippostrongylus brasiliensis]
MLLEVAVLVVIVCEMAPVSATVIGAVGTSGSCDQIQCLNGGYSKDGATYCTCASGYLGPHCESVLTSAPPTSAFAKTSTFNLVIYNAFTDYWGKSGYDLFRNSVAQHLEGFSYSQYNMAVYKGSNAMEQEYRSVVSESKKDDFLTLLQNETLSYPESYSCMNLAFYKPMYNYITKLGLRDTAITVVTQFPAANDDESYDALLELAIAFNIRINVVWISDETFVRCFFLRSTNPQFTDVVIASHYQYQPIAIGAATDCSSGLSLSWLGNDMNTYVIVEGDANATFTGCSAAEIRGSLNSGQTIFQLKNATSNCSLRLTNNGQQCSAKVFGIDGSNVGIRVYSTLVEDVVIDSSRTQPSTEYSLHLALHVERNKIVTSGNITIDSCTIRSDKGDTRQLKMTNRATPSAFNFVSSDTFTCDPTTTGLYWAEVHFTITTTIIVTTTSQALERYVQFTCRNAPTPTNFPINNPITLAYGFANTLPRTIYETFAVTAMNNINNTFGYFGVVRFEVQNESAVIYYPQKDIGSMQNAVYNLYRYGGIAGTPQSSDSQFLMALTTATDSPYLYENSLLMFCMDKLPRSPDYTKFTKLTSKNTLFLMDVSAINRELGYKRTAEPLNEIAAATNGHLIISDQADRQNFANLVQFLCTSGPSQSLLFARSFPYASPSANLGTLNVKQNVQVVITATSSIYGELYIN